MYRKLLKGIVISILFLSILIVGSIAIESEDERTLVGYEYLDAGTVLHFWNTEDDYYLNVSSGMQFTNHYDEYWSTNNFCAGQFMGDAWNEFDCLDSLTMTWNVTTDNASYFNYTGVATKKYGAHTIKIQLTYYLETYDTRMSVIPSITNVGRRTISNDLGFSWNIKDIQVDMQVENNSLVIDQDEYFNSHYNLSNDFSEIFDNTTGYFFINNKDTYEHIYLEWNSSKYHRVVVYPEVGQYNSPVTLLIKVGPLLVDETKTEVLGWVDANPYCGNVGETGNEDICFNDAPSYSHDGDNFSDATMFNSRFPFFKITHSAIMPFGCTFQCVLYSQSEEGGAWLSRYSGTGSPGCYDKFPNAFGKCNNGYCNLLHTENEGNMTQWDLCVYYSGRTCSEAGNVYCGLGSQGPATTSYKGDEVINHSYNANTPSADNVTLIDNFINVTCSYDFDDPDGDGEDTGLREIHWYINDTYTAGYDDQTHLNLTDMPCDNITCEVKVFDTAYFSPTGLEAFDLSNITHNCSGGYCDTFYFGLGTWVISNTVQCVDEEAIAGTNLTIESTGYLNLTNSNVSVDGENYCVYVEDGATLYIDSESKIVV